MRRWMGMPVAAAVVLTACVTINVYFPAAEAKEAAKEFVEKVINEDMQPPKTEDDGGGMAWIPAALRETRIDPLSLVGIGTAQAQGQPDITIKTPAIQAIQAAHVDALRQPAACAFPIRCAGVHARRAGGGACGRQAGTEGSSGGQPGGCRRQPRPQGCVSRGCGCQWPS